MELHFDGICLTLCLTLGLSWFHYKEYGYINEMFVLGPIKTNLNYGHSLYIKQFTLYKAILPNGREGHFANQ